MPEPQWDGDDRRAKDRWHVGKEIPIAFVVITIVQTAVFIAWFSDKAARQETKLDNLTEVVRELRGDRYTREDARRDRELAAQRDNEHDRRLGALEAQVEALVRSVKK